MVKPGPGLSDGGSVGEHANSPRDFGQVSIWHNSWWLIVDADLEPSGTPVDKLDGPLSLYGGDGSVDILRDHVSPVEHAAGHVLAVTRVALHHLVGGLEASVGDFPYAYLFMVSLLRGDNRGIGYQREMYPDQRY